MKLWVEDTRRRRLSLSQESGLELRKVNLPKALLSLGRPDSRGHRGRLGDTGNLGETVSPLPFPRHSPGISPWFGGSKMGIKESLRPYPPKVPTPLQNVGALYVWHMERGRCLYNHRATICTPSFLYLITDHLT